MDGIIEAFKMFAIIAAAFFAGMTQHVAPVCVNGPVAIHVSANAGFEADPHLSGSLLGSAPTC